MKLSRIVVDLAKNVFQLHGVDRHGKAVWRRHPNVAAVALANKTARMAWAMLRHGTDYDSDFAIS